MGEGKRGDATFPTFFFSPLYFFFFPTPSHTSLDHQHGAHAVVAAVVRHAPQEKLLQLGLCVRGHHQRGGAQVRGLAADDAADRVGVDLGLDQVHDGVGADREEAREEALGDEVLGVLDELLVGGGVLVFFFFPLEKGGEVGSGLERPAGTVEGKERKRKEKKKKKTALRSKFLTCCGRKSTGGAPNTAASCKRGMTWMRWMWSPGLEGKRERKRKRKRARERERKERKMKRDKGLRSTRA